MAQQGKEFEGLVQWISSGLHNDAVVTPNARLPDIDCPGQTREIDILVEVTTGPMTVSLIGEVRDRSGRQGSMWIEQVASKRRSVRADAAFVVSRDGFSEPALLKAEALGIRTYTLSAARSEDWGQAVHAATLPFRRPCAGVAITLFEHDSRALIALPPDRIARTAALADGTKTLRDTAESPEVLARIADQVIREVASSAGFVGRKGDPEVDRAVLLKAEPPYEVLDHEGKSRLVGEIGLEVTLGFEVVEVPMAVLRYADGTGRDAAHVLECTVCFGGGWFRLRVMFGPGAPRVRKGDSIRCSLEPLDQRAEDLNARLEVTPTYERDDAGDTRIGLSFQMFYGALAGSDCDEPPSLS